MSPPLECILHRLDLVCFGFFSSFSFSFLHLNTRKIMEIIQRVGAIPHLTKWQNLCKHLIINSGNCDRWGKVDRVYFWLVILFSVFSSWKWIDKNYANCFEKPKKINPLKMIRFFFLLLLGLVFAHYCHPIQIWVAFFFRKIACNTSVGQCEYRVVRIDTRTHCGHKYMHSNAKKKHLYTCSN